MKLATILLALMLATIAGAQELPNAAYAPVEWRPAALQLPLLLHESDYGRSPLVGASQRKSFSINIHYPWMVGYAYSYLSPVQVTTRIGAVSGITTDVGKQGPEWSAQLWDMEVTDWLRDTRGRHRAYWDAQVILHLNAQGYYVKLFAKKPRYGDWSVSSLRFENGERSLVRDSTGGGAHATVFRYGQDEARLRLAMEWLLGTCMRNTNQEHVQELLRGLPKQLQEAVLCRQ